MAIANSALDAANVTTTWQKLVRWIPTSEDAIIASEHRLLSLVKTPYFQEQVNIGSGPLGIKFASTEPSYINTITFDNQLESAPTLVMLHGYGASQGFFFRNFDALAKHFRVIAIDQLGWGASSRPDFTCKNTEETEAWFISSFEAWRKAKNLESFILLGHSFGGYVAAKYALMHPEHLQHLILVGSAGFSAQSDERSEGLLKFRATWKGAILSRLWESNFTFQKIVRGMGRWGPDVVKIYTNARFCSRAVGTIYNKEEPQLFSDYVYHTLAGKASGELCLKYIFAFGALARSPLLPSAADWKVSTSFIYGVDDWIDYRGAVDACMKIPVPKEIIRVPQGGHPVFLDNASGFHAAVLYSCRRFLKIQNAEDLLNGLTKVL